MAELDLRSAKALGLTDPEGALIAQVEKGGPAAKGGVQPYDLVVEINGKKIKSPQELQIAIADSPVGQKTDFKVIREGKKVSLQVVLGERPEGPQRKQKATSKKTLGLTAPFEMGFSVADSDRGLAQEFEMEEDPQRPLVVEVVPNSIASRSGIMVGDIILDVNRKEVLKASEVIKNLKKGVNTLRLVRQNSVLFIMMETR